MNILFVCTGNTCRSSMAEGIFKALLIKNNISNINVSSAGISAFEGDMANENAIKVLKNNGIDISNHKARIITDDIIKNSDLILTMTLSHKKMLSKNYADYSNKMFTLKEFAYKINEENSYGRNLDIDDPFGMNYNVYDLSMKEIKNEIKKIINNIEKIDKFKQ